MSCSRVLLLVAAALAFCCRTDAQISQTEADPLANDTRLARQVTLRAEGLPVSELLALLSQKTGVGLSVEQDIGDEKIVVFNAARPLHDILADTAALFNNAWERVENSGQQPRYRLIRTRRSHEYEDGLAQSATRRILAQLQAQVQALGETPEQLARRPEKDPIRRNLSDAKSRLGTLLYGALSVSQQETLLTRHTCFAHFSDLNPPQQAAVRDIYEGFIAENHAMIEQMQKQLPGVIIHNRRLEQADLDSDAVRFFVDGGEHTYRMGFSLGGDLLTAGAFAVFDKPAHVLLPVHGNPYTGKPLAASAFLPDRKITTDALREKEWLDQLRSLSEASGAPIMADFFRHKSEKTAGENLPPILAANTIKNDALAEGASTLDAFCQPQGYLWWTRGKTLLFRTQTWYNARRYEIADRWLLDVSRRLQAQHGIPMYADVLRLLELTPEQMSGLQSGADNGEAGGRGSAEAKELAVAQFLLELLRDNASPLGNHVPVPTWSDLCSRSVEQLRTQRVLTYDTMTLQQRGQIPAYLQTQPHQYTPEQRTDFFAVVYRPQEAAQSGASANKNVTIRLLGGFGAGLFKTHDPLFTMQTFEGNGITQSNPVILTLPLSIPEDRRGNTRVEIMP